MAEKRTIHGGTIFFLLGFAMALLSMGQIIAVFVSSAIMAAGLVSMKKMPSMEIEY